MRSIIKLDEPYTNEVKPLRTVATVVQENKRLKERLERAMKIMWDLNSAPFDGTFEDKFDKLHNFCADCLMEGWMKDVAAFDVK